MDQLEVAEMIILNDGECPIDPRLCDGCPANSEDEFCSKKWNRDRDLKMKWFKNWVKDNKPITDNIKHPAHYADTVPGIECIQVTQHFNFNRGNAIKYIWRAGHKNNEIEDLKKAIQYLEFEIDRLQKLANV